MYYTIYNCNFATIILAGDENGLTNLAFDVKGAKRKLQIQDSWQKNDEHFADVKGQLDEYFAGSRKSFDVKLNPAGTEYQLKVWKALESIPYAQLRTYKDIALAIGDKNASRAVGSANGKNPIALIVPCHRVVGANDKLTGYAYGLELKKRLLDFEKEHA
ncbi:MAG: methylated-DNA--[protein]-cysteine S-methyltransferase [Eubacteriales bacterium]